MGSTEFDASKSISIIAMLLGTQEMCRSHVIYIFCLTAVKSVHAYGRGEMR